MKNKDKNNQHSSYMYESDIWTHPKFASIFKAIVNNYLHSGAPTSSRKVSRYDSIALSPASVRNVMADLEEMGLIKSPHTSAGRVPTEKGLRFFIDAFLNVDRLCEAEKIQLQEQLSITNSSNEIDDMIYQAGLVLSKITGAATMVLAQKNNIKVDYTEFLRIDHNRALLIIVGIDGSVENRILLIDPQTTNESLQTATNYLNHLSHKLTLGEIKKKLGSLNDNIRKELDILAAELIKAGLADWKIKPNKTTLVVHGRSNLLECFSDPDDMERIKKLLDDLERQHEIASILEAADQGPGVKIFIGSENSLFSLSGSSLIIAPYGQTDDQESNIIGALGVIGPTYQNYSRIIPIINYTRQFLTEVLDHKK